ncbi:hypothetical protein AWW68_04075 [Roseivirga spongicola]|uniref:Uncharacterized protein n=1 Tax=Roseivirga spongicola TaxID=333140 RepID=A0A150XGY2_9BACT|nr:hypothetical protein [Roseivirga spongicola]KYG77955.1 hypothetical protein AWW68_04075 [Roseivirga spongicola]
MANLDFYKSFERITKALVLKLAEGDYETVINTIDWLDKRLQKLFELIDKDESLFFEIFDPEREFQPRLIEQNPVERLSFSDLLSSGQIGVSSRPIKREPPRLIDQKIDLGLSGRRRDSKSFLEKLLQLFYSIWDKARNVRGYSIDILVGQIYHNLMVYVSQMEESKIETQSVLRRLFWIFENQAYELKRGKIELEFIWRADLFNSIDLIFKESFPPKYSSLVQGHIFNMLLSTFDEDLILQKRYIESITSKHRIPLSSDFTNLLDEIHFDQAHKVGLGVLTDMVFKERDKLITKIKYIDESKIDDLESLDIYRNQVAEFFKTDWINVYKSEENNWKVEKEKARLSIVYKANLEKNTLFLLLLYSISQDRFDFVNYIFENNTPHKLSSSWSSPEYAPIQLDQTLNLFLNRHLQTNNQLIFSSDKYETDHLINILILFSLKYVLKYEYKFYVKNDNIIQGYFDDKNAEELKSYEYRLERLDSMIKNENQRWKEKNFSQKNLEQISALLSKISRVVKSSLQDLEQLTKIPEGVFQNLIVSIEQNLSDKSIFLKLISEFAEVNYSQELTEFDDKKGHIGVYTNEVHFRRSFLPNWPVPTYGTIEYFSEKIRSTLDLLLFRKIKESFEKHSSREFEVIKESNVFVDSLEKSDFEIVLFRNYHPSSLMRKIEGFIPNYQVEKGLFESFKNRFVGLLNNVPIFWYIDPFKDQNEVILFNKSDLGSIEVLRTKETEEAHYNSEFINAQIFDLPIDPEAKQKILEESPVWLEREAEETGKSIDDILMEKVWIKIYAYLKYVPAQNLGATKTIKIEF